MAKTKKIATSVAAVATAAALLLGGTFAWQSVNQTALNEASDVINPGGRLHDDFNGSNKDVYVENFAEEPIYARIQLNEYFEIIANYGVEGVESSTAILGSKTTNEGTGEAEYTYKTFKNYASLDGTTVAAGVDADTYDPNAEEGEAGYAWWSWETGGSTVYMPTFNKNKDSLQADINGTYVDAVGGISDRNGSQYSGYEEYAEDAEKIENAIYDADANNIEDGNTTEVEETHYATATGGATLMSMQEWIGNGSQPGEYWVYDTDGWVYWAQAIQPNTATGLLLDGIQLNQVMDDSWYYAINVVAQFVTGDDTGVSDDTGFYDTSDPALPAISTEAEALLNTIIEANEAAAPDEGGEDEGDEGDQYVPFNIVNNISDNKWDDVIYMSADAFASNGTGDGLQLMTFYGDTSENGYASDVEWSLESLDDKSYTANESADEYSVYTIKTNKTVDEITVDETFMFRVTASDTQYPDNPFTSEYTVIIGEEPNAVTITTDDGTLDSLSDSVALRLNNYEGNVTWSADSEDVVVTGDENGTATVAFKTFEAPNAPSAYEYTITATDAADNSATYTVKYVPTTYTAMQVNYMGNEISRSEIVAESTVNLAANRYDMDFYIAETSQVTWTVTHEGTSTNYDKVLGDEFVDGEYTVVAICVTPSGSTETITFTVIAEYSDMM